jgi:hypothetical protein
LHEPHKIFAPPEERDLIGLAALPSSAANLPLTWSILLANKFLAKHIFESYDFKARISKLEIARTPSGFLSNAPF